MYLAFIGKEGVVRGDGRMGLVEIKAQIYAIEKSPDFEIDTPR
jgi:hypothetical protein